jgi:hypothetical protein
MRATVEIDVRNFKNKEEFLYVEDLSILLVITGALHSVGLIQLILQHYNSIPSLFHSIEQKLTN